MDINVQNFLNVLSSAIFNRKMQLLEPVDYVKILNISISQQIPALIFEKLCENENFKKEDIYKTLAPQVIMSVLGQAQKSTMFLDLYKKFNSVDLYPIVVKGIVCRQLYGSLGDHRPSSDEDIVIEESQFDNVCDLLEREGYKPEVSRDSIDLKTLQALGFRNEKSGMKIEVHVNPIGKSNSLQNKMDIYFHDIFTDYTELDIQGVKIRTLNHSKHFLFLIFHAFKHFTGCGFGIRQVVDLLLYENAYEDEIDWDYIMKALRDTNSEKFYADLISIGNTYLGFDIKKHCKECCPSDLLNDVINNGIFGNDTEAKKIAGTITSNSIDSEYNDNEKNNVFKIIFPSKEYMIVRNPELKYKPWLLPIRYIQRWITFLDKNRHKRVNIAKESMDIGNRRIALLKKYGIVK